MTTKIQPITGSQLHADFGEIEGFNTCIKSHDEIWQAAAGAVLELDNLLYYGGTDAEAAPLVEKYNALLASAKALNQEEEPDSDDPTVQYVHLHGDEAWSADCPACLRRIAHSDNEHYEDLNRVHDASNGANHYDNEFPTYYDAQGREHGEF